MHTDFFGNTVTAVEDWYDGNDPLVREVVRKACSRFPNQDIKEIRHLIKGLYGWLDQTKDWDNVLKMAGARYLDEQGNIVEIDLPPDFDAVEHLMAIHEQLFKESDDVFYTLEDALMLITLREAEANNTALAIKAFNIGSSQKLEKIKKEFLEKKRQDKENRIKGGTQPKRREAIYQYTCQLVKENPTLTAKQAWAKFPESAHAEHLNGFLVYRDDEELVQKEDQTGQDQILKFPSFKRYVTDAKKESNN